MKITSASSNCANLVKKFEGFRSKPYLCPANVPTIGYGTTRYEDGRKVSLTDPAVTEIRATELLMHDLQKFANYVDSYCRDDIKQNQFDALVSFTFNLGPGTLQRSTLRRKINQGYLKEAPKEIKKYVYASGKKWPGLIKRRNNEAYLFSLDLNNSEV